jgi:hypothetical protein
MSLEEACRRVERNEPPIKSFTFKLRVYTNEVVVGLNADFNWCIRIPSDEGDVFDDPDVWRRLGSAMKSNPTLRTFNIFYDERIMGEIQNHPLAAACLEAFYDELKDNKLIERLALHNLKRVLPTFNLRYFLQHNTNIRSLFCTRLVNQDGLMTREQVNTMASALRGVHLKCFNIECLRFGNNNEAFEEIVSACTRVHELVVRVRFTANSQVAALASLLRDPSALLETLTIMEDDNEALTFGTDGFNFCQREIAASLVGNTKLKSLKTCSGAPMDIFDNLLCDSSSLENICDSNHTLEEINDSNRFTSGISDRTLDCLLLNKIENKKKVIQNKIIQFYFVGDFDLAPFASLPLSVLARVMSLGERVEFDLVSCANMSRAFLDKYQRIHLEGIPNKQTAIFELLRGIPELCNASARSVQLKENNNNSVELLGSKRQKVHK